MEVSAMKSPVAQWTLCICAFFEFCVVIWFIVDGTKFIVNLSVVLKKI